MVDAGDELASLYSPDLVVTVQNLLDAKREQQPANSGKRADSGWNCWESTTTRSTRSSPAARTNTHLTDSLADQRAT